MALLWAVLAVAAAAADANKDFPGRVAARDGRFVLAESGEAVAPRGFHYIRILPSSVHYVFTPGRYDPQAAETMLADLEAHGFNLVRVFVGLEAVGGENGLNPALMDNVADFLRRARAHGVWVIPVKTHVPGVPRYKAIEDRAAEEFPVGRAPFGDNRRYMSQAAIDAKALYLKDFIEAIRERGPQLLEVIWAYELENESCMRMDQAPFTLEGSYTPVTGTTYDLGDAAELQQMADDCAVYWAHALTEAVKEADPHAMVSTSVFTYRAVGRTGPGQLLTDETADARFPLRPLALAGATLDYLDIHFYPADVGTIETDFATIEFDQTRRRCEETGKPLFVGEIGAFRFLFPTVEAAAQRMRACIAYLLEHGFSGYCYWTYDCAEQTPLHNGKTAGGEIMEALPRP